MRRTIPLIAMFLAAGAGGALAQPRSPTPMPPQRMPPERMPPQPMPPQPMPPQQVPPQQVPPQQVPPKPVWDSRGWVPLGERTVNGRDDHDRIEVGKYEGKFQKLTMVVENSDLELVDFKIVFGDRTEYHPKLSHVFREGQRTRAIDLPPAEAVIRFIDIRYKNLPGGGDARVQVWGLRTGDAVPPPAPPPVKRSWDTRGWTMLGQRQVNGRFDHDRIEVSPYEGKFAKLTMAVEDSDLELIDFRIEFADRTEYHPRLSHLFKEGQRTRVIDLPPSERAIRFIDIKYKNTPGGGPASVEVWALRTGDATPPPVKRSWDTRGWTMLGQRQVNGRFDHDRIEVGKYEGKFTKLTMGVEDSDLELIDFRIEFADRTEYHPRLSHLFKEGQRTRVIDLPPSENAIRFIDIKYKNTPGGGPASVEVWGLRSDAPAAWDSKGWTLLGERTVDGSREDTDRIAVSRWDGKFRKLTVVVLDSDLEMVDLTIKFARGKPFHPDVRAVFRENSRTKVIDFPGDERAIKWIEFKYRNLPGGGRARVQVWAK